MNKQEVANLMTQLHDDACEYAKSEFDYALDGTAASVGLIDKMIDHLLVTSPEQLQDDKTLFTLSNVFGAYVGEVFRRNVGGEWVYKESEQQPPAVFLEVGGASYTFAGIAYKRLVDESRITLEQYLVNAVMNHTA